MRKKVDGLGIIIDIFDNNAIGNNDIFGKIFKHLRHFDLIGLFPPKIIAGFLKSFCKF